MVVISTVLHGLLLGAMAIVAGFIALVVFCSLVLGAIVVFTLVMDLAADRRHDRYKPNA